jgi:hypothetical protein
MGALRVHDLARRSARARRAGLIAALVALVAPAPAAAQDAVVEFPSSDSTIVASRGFLNSEEVGYFWSAERGDGVSKTFTGPPAVTRAILRLDVVRNRLEEPAVEWEVRLNGVAVGAFTVARGVTGPFAVDLSFPAIAGPTYEVALRVTNEVSPGAGSHTLAFAAAHAHSLELFAPPPALVPPPPTAVDLDVDDDGVADAVDRSVVVDPAPQPNETVTARVTRGTVLIREASGAVRPLEGTETVPVGATVDATAGRIALTSAADTRGAVQTGTFYSGVFRIAQRRERTRAGRRSRRLVTELVLTGGSFGCRGAQAAQRRRRPVRRLWGNARGRFRTRGRGSAATVRGTVWLTEDRCEGTLTRVRRGRVEVRDFARRRTVVVSAGGRYLARVRRPRGR